MTRNEIIDALARGAKITKSSAEIILDKYIASLKQKSVKGELGVKSSPRKPLGSKQNIFGKETISQKSPERRFRAIVKKGKYGKIKAGAAKKQGGGSDDVGPKKK